jgi:hypothetical protein
MRIVKTPIVKGPGTVTWGFVAISAICAITAGSAAAPGEANTLAIAGRTNSTPWVAAAGSFVAVSWAAANAGKGDIYVAVSRDGGRTFAVPVMVNATAGDARISGEIAPRVSLRPIAGAAPEIVVTWNARDGGTSIRTARSADGGRSFGAPVTLQTSGAAGDRGWQATTIDPQGGVHAIWLDHREMAASKDAHAGHKGEHDGVAMAQKSALYYSDGRPGGERELFKGVCYCCKTAMAAAPDGSLYAAWRHVFEGNMRDMGFTVSRDGGRTFSPLARVHHDRWAINGCPDDGPAMAIDRAGTVHLVWPTVLNGTEGALHYATSRDGKSFNAPIRVLTLGGPKPSHPQITIDGAGRAVVAWDEVRDGVRLAAFRRVMVSREGQPAFSPIETLSAGPASYPMLAAASTGLVAVWTSGTPERSVIGVQIVK